MSNPKTYLCIFANIKQNSKVELTLDSPPSGWPLCRSGLGLRSWRKLLRQHYFPSGASHVDTPPSFCPENTHKNTHTEVSHKQILVSTDLFSSFSLCVLLFYTPFKKGAVLNVVPYFCVLSTFWVIYGYVTC